MLLVFLGGSKDRVRGIEWIHDQWCQAFHDIECQGIPDGAEISGDDSEWICRKFEQNSSLLQ